LRRLSAFPDRLLVITAALSQVKSRYEHSPANPNEITQSLIATLAGLHVPFLCVKTHELGEEIVAPGPPLPLARIKRPRPQPCRRLFVADTPRVPKTELDAHWEVALRLNESIVRVIFRHELMVL
jgi:hypothetical protein